MPKYLTEKDKTNIEKRYIREEQFNNNDFLGARFRVEQELKPITNYVWYKYSSIRTEYNREKALSNVAGLINPYYSQKVLRSKRKYEQAKLVKDSVDVIFEIFTQNRDNLFFDMKSFYKDQISNYIVKLTNYLP